MADGTPEIPGKVRASVAQAAPVLFDTPNTLRKLADLVAAAARRGAELVVFPEAFVGGYPKGHDFGVSVGMRTSEGRDEFRRLSESAVEVPGPATEFIGSAAKDHGLHLVVGVTERDGGTLYCTALTFGPDGSLLGKHRKLMPTAMERVIWGSGDGSTLPVVPRHEQTPSGTCAGDFPARTHQGACNRDVTPSRTRREKARSITAPGFFAITIVRPLNRR